MSVGTLGFGRPIETASLTAHAISLETDGFPQFNEKFGELGPDGTYQVPARWQAGLSNVSPYILNHSPPDLELTLPNLDYTRRLLTVVKSSVSSSTVS